VVIVVSFFVATSFWDLAIHWSEFSFVRPGEAQEVVEEEHGYVYHAVGDVGNDDERQPYFKDEGEDVHHHQSAVLTSYIEGGAQAD
jgi:hypothetical protein